MYKSFKVEGSFLLFPALCDVPNFIPSLRTYFLRGYSSWGCYSVKRLWSRLGLLESHGLISDLRYISSAAAPLSYRSEFVFWWCADDASDVLSLLVGLAALSRGGDVQPLPDLEFVHPAAHAVLFHLGVFSQLGMGNYLSADHNVSKIR